MFSVADNYFSLQKDVSRFQPDTHVAKYEKDVTQSGRSETIAAFPRWKSLMRETCLQGDAGVLPFQLVQRHSRFFFQPNEN